VEQCLKELLAWKEKDSLLHVSSFSGLLGKWVCMSYIKNYNGKLDASIVVELKEIGLDGQNGIVDMKNSGNTKHSMKIVWSLEEKSLKDNINE
jgi:hypothetical protein